MSPKTILIAALVTLASCSGVDATAVPSETTDRPTSSTEGAAQTPASATTTIPETSAFETALDATIAAGSYEFGGQLIAYVGSSSIATGLHGWVDGTSQLIVTESNGAIVETLVVDGIATVTQDDSTSTADLGAIEAAPSFGLLGAIDIQEETPGMVKGSVSDSLTAGETANGTLNVTVWYTTFINAYEISDPNGAWELSMTFSNVGSFDSSGTP